MGKIYVATAPNKKQKKYVGQTTRTLEERLEEHQKENSGCPAFARAIKKYGWDTFAIDFYECPDEDLNNHERWLIRLMGTLAPNGYNLTEGGTNGKRSEETKRKIGDSKKGNKNWLGKTHSEEYKKKMSGVHKGKIVSKDSKKKMSDAAKGKIVSKETKKKMSDSRKGGNNPRARPVWVYGILYDSCRSASDSLRFLFGMKSNFILKWVKSKKHPEIFFAQL
ncbi:hypothetical protein PBCV1_A495R [Paramecium bursaria Chlorella virus 1]|uniref:GIY-YIG domain-containing protein n=1 Tax=Paramecium bursaria Chlorella virus 1 TaxID=10506 RepID=Q98545_PBCV1|nr:hypothetical protein PBCV1_A495R [Paramecium bursaria Chlorella virus 1]AAC96862.1 hypothetical protein [Paramecium bursaria Chlorella virus 1]